MEIGMEYPYKYQVLKTNNNKNNTNNNRVVEI